MPPLNDKKLEKIQKLLEIANEDFATPEDVIKMSEALISVVVTEKNKLESQLNETNSKLSTEITKTLTKLTEKENGLRAIISRLSTETDKALTNTQNTLSREIKRVEAKIPTKTDLTGLEREISAIKDSFNTLPTELTINNEAIRDGLELLPARDENGIDQRLDKSAIKGLDELIEDLRTIARTSQPQAVGVRLLRYLSDVNIEGITDGQTLVWDATTQRFIPGTGGTGGGHTIEDEGTPLTQRTNLNFVGAGVAVTDDAGNDATIVTITSGGGGGGTVNSIVAGNNIDVDATDPANPIVSVETLTLADISDVTASVTELNYIDGVTSAIQSQLNNKEPLKGADDNYVTDAEKAALHAAVTVTDSTSIDITLTGQDITAQREALTGAITAPKNSNTTSLGSFTKAQLDTAVSDANVLYVGDVTTNATHTGEVTGSGALTVDKTAITNKTDTVITASDRIIFADASDTDNLKSDTVQGILDLVTGGSNTYFNDIYIDQSGGTSDTYGVITGTINGSNATFTVSQSAYATGTLQVWLNGQLMTQGSSEDWVETTPASGTFTFNTAPASGSEITVAYQKVVVDSSTVVTTSTVTELAQDAVGTILVDSSEIDFTYSDATPSITASLVAGSIDETKLDTSVNASLDLADSAVQPAGIANLVTGPASAVDNAVARYDSTTGKLIQNSAMTVDDAGAFTATDGSKVTGATTGAFGYIVLAVENTDDEGRAELSLDTDDGAYAGFIAMGGSNASGTSRRLDIGTRVNGPIGWWTNDTVRAQMEATGEMEFFHEVTVPYEVFDDTAWSTSPLVPTQQAVRDRFRVAVVRVIHGSTAGTTRPDTPYVEWVGSVEPTNATNNDTWVVTP